VAGPHPATGVTLIRELGVDSLARSPFKVREFIPLDSRPRLDT